MEGSLIAAFGFELQLDVDTWGTAASESGAPLSSLSSCLLHTD